MTIIKFQQELFRVLMRARIPQRIKTEQSLERQFVIPHAIRVAAAQDDILLFSHPWGNRLRCTGDCAEKPPGGRGRVLGCPDCWAASKAWATVEAFGTRHTFDMMAKDRAGRTLAVEIKLVHARGGRMPNGDIQRFLGQVALAATKHDAVIGLCCYRGRLRNFRHDDDAVRQWFKELEAEIVFRQAV